MNEPQRITPRTLKGFRDYLPEAMIPRERLIDVARRVYRSYGFSPIDTPALEYLEILAGKGSEETDKQLYKFKDHGGRDVGLRFDLTVPLARFAAQHIGELGIPFKRYHIATVWRGENTQRGRYREFMQCDFDTIGTKSVAADIETVVVIHDLMRAIGFDKFQIQLNNRMLLTGLLEKLDLTDHAAAVLRELDKLNKIGPTALCNELIAIVGVSENKPMKLKNFHTFEIYGSNDEILRQAESMVSANQTGQEGIAKLRELLAGVTAAGVPAMVAGECIACSFEFSDRPRIGLLHRHGIRNISQRLSGYRQRVFRRAVRQSGRAFHRAGTARASGPRWGWIGSWRRWKNWA